MYSIDKQFQYLLSSIINAGEKIVTRNSTVIRNPNQTLVIKSTPLISVRTTAWKNAIREMEWFLSGSSNINDLHPAVRKWWEPWTDESGMVINNYSSQFREFYGYPSYSGEEYTDQIEYLIDGIKNHPFSRRNVITTWNTHDMAQLETKITNCHCSLLQCFVNPDNTLHITMYQRSCDTVLGLPHNLIQYWAFLMWLAHKTDKKVGSFTWIGGDVHIYESHTNTAEKIINTDISNISTPTLIYTPTSEDFKADDFSLSEKYEPIIKESLQMVI